MTTSRLSRAGLPPPWHSVRAGARGPARVGFGLHGGRRLLGRLVLLVVLVVVRIIGLVLSRDVEGGDEIRDVSLVVPAPARSS
ncbi:hypothetical protein [Streptomyces mirabilis]